MVGMRIVGHGAISMGIDEPFERATAALGNLPIKEAVAPRVSRRYGRLSKMIAIAAQRAMQSAGLEELSGIPVVAATAVGETKAALGILEQIHETGGSRISPALVQNSVHNAPAGYLHIATKNRAPSLTVSQGWLSGEAALATAHDLLLTGAKQVLVVAGDEADPAWIDRLEQLRAKALADTLARASYQEGATAWLLENQDDITGPRLVATVERRHVTTAEISNLLSRHGITVTETTEVRLRKNGGGEELKPVVADVLSRALDDVHVDGIGAGTVQSAPLLRVTKYLNDSNDHSLLLLAAEAEELGLIWLGRS